MNIPSSNAFFASTLGIVATGAFIGIIAITLQLLGNPGNMGVCVACFERDIAGALGLHQAAVVQYLRPEILGMGLGAFAAAWWSKDYRARGGSSPIVRFCLGVVAAVGALIFLGCPWRALLRLAGGDLNAIFGLLGLVAGIFIGTLFLRKGFTLGRSTQKASGLGLIFPAVLLALLALRLAFPQTEGQPSTGILLYSLKGPGAQHAPLLASLAGGLLVGVLAQRSRFCTVGALRDLILFRHLHLFWGVAALVVTAFGMNMLFGTFTPSFEGQPVAHTQSLWNFLGMALAGLAFVLAGGCPGRQLFMSGEGDTDAAMFALGVLVGGGVAHVFGTASSGAGVSANGPLAVAVGFAFCLVVAGYYTLRKA